jgi:spore germination protein
MRWSKKQLRWGVLAVAGLAIGLAGLIWFFWDEPLISPLTAIPTFRFLTGTEPPSTNGKVVYGYLPYWNLSKAALQPEITHVSYFSLTIAANGKIITVDPSEGTAEPGYHRLQSDQWLDLSNQAVEKGQKIEITLTQFNNDDIVAFLSSPQAHQNLLDSLDSILLAYPVSGINIDIEYSGEVTDAMRKRMTEVVTKTRKHLNQKYSQVQLSIAMYASGAKGGQIWQVDKLGEQVDYIVIMAYDFHRRSSPQAGPVAPLFGGKDLWDSDISQHLQDFLKVVPPEKLLLGVPFYGYEWQTTSRLPQAHTFPDTGATASFSRVQELLTRREELKVEEHWNESALSPYLSYIEKGQTFVVYYENSRSLSYKLDYVNELNLGGIAIWALGYEGDSRELWDVIQRKL